MARQEVHLGDIGTSFRATVMDQDGTVVDISSATRTMKFLKPDRTVIEKPAALVTDGTDGQMEYVTVSGDLDMRGTWRMQGKVVIGAGTWHTDEYLFEVHRALVTTV